MFELACALAGALFLLAAVGLAVVVDLAEGRLADRAAPWSRAAPSPLGRPARRLRLVPLDP